jgi:hypothetical protein
MFGMPRLLLVGPAIIAVFGFAAFDECFPIPRHALAYRKLFLGNQLGIFRLGRSNDKQGSCAGKNSQERIKSVHSTSPIQSIKLTGQIGASVRLDKVSVLCWVADSGQGHPLQDRSAKAYRLAVPTEAGPQGSVCLVRGGRLQSIGSRVLGSGSNQPGTVGWSRTSVKSTSTFLALGLLDGGSKRGDHQIEFRMESATANNQQLVGYVHT